jgi:hypothetical protein
MSDEKTGQPEPTEPTEDTEGHGIQTGSGDEFASQKFATQKFASEK